MNKPVTDTDKTLEILRERGTRGIHSFHLNFLVGTIRAAARINDLKKQGYAISSTPEKMGHTWGVRYTLLEKPQETPKRKTYIFEGNVCREVWV